MAYNRTGTLAIQLDQAHRERHNNARQKEEMKPTVLLLSTYPIVEPRHGGQIRLANIAKTYADAGWQVESIAIYETGGYAPNSLGKRDIPFPATTPFRKYREYAAPLISDLLAGRYAAAEGGALPAVLEKLPVQIEAVHVEQPWLWPLAQRIKQIQEYKGACLIYGSQNIEAPLKHDILRNADVRDADDIALEIDALEKLASAEADVVLAVTQSDLDTLVKWGAKNAVLAANGIAPWEATPQALEKWKPRLPQTPWLLYVASAHPPNFNGFPQCLGNSLGSLPPDSRLVIAGSVSEFIAREFAATRWHSLNSARLQLLHTLDDEDLAAVKTLAHGFLLPIAHGGDPISRLPRRFIQEPT
ncbi:hypothetical protein LP416_18285 [Polaromonas sp. P2-4]|nr:hypothetical protein LP416_18285 [Polaromonas sp. P2-4]